MDQFSGLSFVYLQKSMTADETVLAKQAFEKFAALHGIII